MKDILRPILKLSVVLPGLLLAYFPVKSYLKRSVYRNAPNLPVEIRNDCAVRLRGVCVCEQLIPGRQRCDCSAYAATAGRAVVLS